MTRMACASGTKGGPGVERSVIYVFRFAYESESEWCVKFVGGWMFVLLDHAAGCQQVGVSRLVSSHLSCRLKGRIPAMARSFAYMRLLTGPPADAKGHPHFLPWEFMVPCRRGLDAAHVC